jgi:hypothetical protein
MYNWLHKNKLKNDAVNLKFNIICNNFYKNSFPILPQKTSDKEQNIQPEYDKPKYKWVTFPHVGKETFVTKLFTQTNFKILLNIFLNLKNKALTNI